MCRKKRTVRGSARWEGWIKGAAVTDASRWRYQGTDVMEAILILRVGSCTLRSMKESDRKERSRNARKRGLSMEGAMNRLTIKIYQ